MNEMSQQHKAIASIDYLQKNILGKGKLAIALSGGLDSSVLLAYTVTILGHQNCIALTAKTPYMMEQELQEATQLCSQLKVRQIIMSLPIPDSIVNNPPARCYLCKKELFIELKKRAIDEGFPFIADGTNQDDLGDYRPGLQAITELGIASPFKESGFGKQAIRQLGSQLGLSSTLINKPPYACLLTRIEHHTPITEDTLRRIDQAENFLRSLGITACRVRVHTVSSNLPLLARLEIPAESWSSLLSDDRIPRICQHLKQLGFAHVTLDLEGYRRGSMNQEPQS
ncbi:MAG: ATP-dependent sacrificial sulfur transferase LarE [Akkermansia sp.]